MPLAEADRQLMNRVKLFRGMQAAEIDHVLAHGHAVEHGQGETVFHEGTEGTRLFIVLDGVVAIRVKGKYLAKCRAGEAFGEMAVLNQRPRSATATASTAVRLFCLDESDIHAILDHKVAVRFLLNVVYALSERLEAGNAWTTVAFEEMRQRSETRRSESAPAGPHA